MLFFNAAISLSIELYVATVKHCPVGFDVGALDVGFIVIGSMVGPGVGVDVVGFIVVGQGIIIDTVGFIVDGSGVTSFVGVRVVGGSRFSVVTELSAETTLFISSCDRLPHQTVQTKRNIL